MKKAIKKNRVLTELQKGDNFAFVNNLTNFAKCINGKYTQYGRKEIIKSGYICTYIKCNRKTETAYFEINGYLYSCYIRTKII